MFKFALWIARKDGRHADFHPIEQLSELLLFFAAQIDLAYQP
jgi:hypothetical protein